MEGVEADIIAKISLENYDLEGEGLIVIGRRVLSFNRLRYYDRPL